MLKRYAVAVAAAGHCLKMAMSAHSVRGFIGEEDIDAAPKTTGRVTMIRDEHAPSRGGHPRLTRRIRLIYRGRQETDAGNSPDVVALPALPSFNRGR
jgi:hypothetical protein